MWWTRHVRFIASNSESLQPKPNQAKPILCKWCGRALNAIVIWYDGSGTVEVEVAAVAMMIMMMMITALAHHSKWPNVSHLWQKTHYAWMSMIFSECLTITANDCHQSVVNFTNNYVQWNDLYYSLGEWLGEWVNECVRACVGMCDVCCWYGSRQWAIAVYKCGQ